jgi:TIR domain
MPSIKDRSIRKIPKIFISYRREDSAAVVYHIYEILTARYGSGSVFVDIDDVPSGVDFREHLKAELDQTDLVLAVVGPRWCGERESGASRINDDNDFVRAEIESAFSHKITTIPILVLGANMPKPEELPASLQEFFFLNATRVDTGVDFYHHVDRLIRSIDEILKGHYRLSPWPRRSSFKSLQQPSPWVIVGTWLLSAVLALELAPPWPSHSGVVTTIAVGLLSIAAYYLLRSSKLQTINKLTLYGTIVVVLATSSYLPLFSQFTYVAPTTGERFAKGFVCTADATLLYADKCPYLGLDELRGAEYSAERLWTSQSVTEIKVGLFGLWMIGSIGLAVAAAALANSFNRDP